MMVDELNTNEEILQEDVFQVIKKMDFSSGWTWFEMVFVGFGGQTNSDTKLCLFLIFSLIFASFPCEILETFTSSSL